MSEVYNRVFLASHLIRVLNFNVGVVLGDRVPSTSSIDLVWHDAILRILRPLLISVVLVVEVLIRIYGLASAVRAIHCKLRTDRKPRVIISQLRVQVPLTIPDFLAITILYALPERSSVLGAHGQVVMLSVH